MSLITCVADCFQQHDNLKPCFQPLNDGSALMLGTEAIFKGHCGQLIKYLIYGARRLEKKCIVIVDLYPLLVLQFEYISSWKTMKITTLLNWLLYCQNLTKIIYGIFSKWFTALQWRHNECEGVSNHQPDDCLLKRLFRCRSKKTSKLRVIRLCEGNSPATGECPAQMASNA